MSPQDVGSVTNNKVSNNDNKIIIRLNIASIKSIVKFKLTPIPP